MLAGLRRRGSEQVKAEIVAKKEKEVDVSRLAFAMQRARLQLRRYREERREAVRQYVGGHWSDEGSSQKVPINLISLYVNIVSRTLIAKNPRVMLSTFDRGNKATIKTMEKWANKEIERMRMANTLQRIVLDALFSVGICKVALATPADAAIMAWRLGAGMPFIERVDLDDFVFDVHARDFSEVGFIGHRYRVPLEVIRDSKLYSKQRKQLTPSTDPIYNLEGDQRISALGRMPYAVDSEEFEDFVDLWEVYLPRHRLVFTLADDDLTGPSTGGVGGDTEPLRVQDWVGPETGPYHVLAYGLVPGNAMPKAPIPDLMDLHLDVNNIYRKLTRQAQRQKQNVFVQGGATEDGNRVMNANDGEVLRVDNPERLKQVDHGGPNQMNLNYALHLFDRFMTLAGNLEMMGGLAPQSKTLGQDQMLERNASGQIASMQSVTVDFTSEVLEAMCWYWWHDPFLVMRVNHSMPGLPEITTQIKVGPDKRSGRFEDLGVSVDPYSMQHATPQMRMAALNQVVQTIVMPMMQLLQQQGIAFDMNVYLQKVAAYMDMPDLSEIITIQEPPAAETSPGTPAGPGLPQQTTRNYVRRSLGGNTPQAREAALAATPQPSQNGQAQPEGAGT